jgi:hypothetical protein
LIAIVPDSYREPPASVKASFFPVCYYLSMPKDDFEALRGELLRAKQEKSRSYQDLADAIEASDDDPISPETLRYTLTRRASIPPRRILEPVGRSVGLGWDQILRLL